MNPTRPRVATVVPFKSATTSDRRTLDMAVKLYRAGISTGDVVITLMRSGVPNPFRVAEEAWEFVDKNGGFP